MLCYYMTTERVPVQTKNERFSLSGLLSELFHNRALIGIVVSALLFLLAQLSISNMGAYIYPNYFGVVKGLSMATMLGTIITLVLSAFTVRLSERFGKKEISAAGALIGAAALIAAYFVHTKNVYVWLVFYGISYIGMAAFNLVCWAMIADVIDDAEVKTGTRSDGTIYAIYSFARKLGQAGSSGLTGALLSIIGYSTATAFDTKVVDGIYNMTCLVPAIAYVLMALSLYFLYPLSKSKVQENAAVLRAKREK